MPGGALDLRAGSRLWFDGGSWTVCEVSAAAARLRDDRGSYRSAAIAELIDAAAGIDKTGLDESDGDDHGLGADGMLPSVALASLTSRQRTAVEEQVDVLAPLLNLAGIDGNGSRERIELAAKELGVSARTVRRRLQRLDELGPAGLIDERLLKNTRRTVDPRWDAACLEVLREFSDLSTPSKQTVIRRTTKAFLAAVPDGRPPTSATVYRRVDELDHGRYTFREAKQRRSVAKRPQGVLGQLRPTCPGEYVLMDGYKLDVFAMEPVTMRWVNTELTVAMDLFDRSIKGIRLRPHAAKSADVASVLYQALTPQRWGSGVGAPTGPYGGVPDHIVLGSTGVLPDTIVIDHGKVYMSAHTLGVCRRLGISVQPAIPNKPTDKPALERFFKTLRLSLMDKLPGYKGPNVASRGKDVEKGAFYYVSELEQLVREWVGEVYHHRPHQGLRDPRLPKVNLSPEEMFNRGIEMSGLLRLPANPDLRFDLLEIEWRAIHHYGVDIDGRRYDGPALNAYRGRRSDYGGAHAGRWPFMVDADDVRAVHFQDPVDRSWHRLEWRLGVGINAPFSRDAADYTRRVSVQQHRHVDPQQAVEDLLVRWSREEVLGRRERTLAIRLAAQPALETPDTGPPQDRASIPGVIDLLSRRADRASAHLGHPDDLEDVFARFYAEHPDVDGLEVFDD